MGTSLQDFESTPGGVAHVIIVVQIESVGSIQIGLVIFNCFYFSWLFIYLFAYV